MKNFVPVMAAMVVPEPALVRAIQDQQPGHALDLACGLGRNAIHLASQGWRVTALDSSQVAINSLPAESMRALLTLKRRIFKIPPDSYDLICDCYYLHRPLFRKFAAALGRVDFSLV